MTLAVVHADDLGLSEFINRGILRAHLEGIVTSTSFLANLPASEAGARDAIERAPALEVGLHLNFTEGRPLTGRSSLTDSDGRFRPLARQLVALLAGSVRNEDARTEALAQLARARELGLRPNHLDGHEHVHLFGAARRASLAMAREEGIALRRPREDVLAPVEGSVTYAGRRMLLRVAAGWPGFRGTRNARSFVDLTGPGRGRSPSWLVDRLRGREGVVEVICHPGEAGGPDDDRLRGRRPEELAILTTPGLRERFAEAGIILATFAEAIPRESP